MTRAVRALLVVTPWLWVGALVAAAYVASRPAPGVAAYGISAIVYEIGSLVCHQRPERSFHLWGAQLAVCARCAGLYGGASVAALAIATPRGTGIDRRVWQRAKALLFAGAFPTVLTLAFEWTTGIMPAHATRAAAGFVLGAVVMMVMLAGTTSEPAVGIH